MTRQKLFLIGITLVLMIGLILPATVFADGTSQSTDQKVTHLKPTRLGSAIVEGWCDGKMKVVEMDLSKYKSELEHGASLQEVLDKATRGHEWYYIPGHYIYDERVEIYGPPYSYDSGDESEVHTDWTGYQHFYQGWLDTNYIFHGIEYWGGEARTHIEFTTSIDAWVCVIYKGPYNKAWYSGDYQNWYN